MRRSGASQYRMCGEHSMYKARNHDKNAVMTELPALRCRPRASASTIRTQNPLEDYRMTCCILSTAPSISPCQTSMPWGSTIK